MRPSAIRHAGDAAPTVRERGVGGPGARRDARPTPPRGGRRARPRCATPLGLGRRILLVEDEESSAVLVAAYLRSLGCVVDTAGRASEALSLAADCPPDLLIADIALAGRRNGLDVVRALRAEYPALPTIVFTALPQRELRRFSSRLAGCLLLLKPIELFELERGVRHLLGG